MNQSPLSNVKRIANLRIPSIRFLHTLLIEPCSNDEEISRKERVLNWILVGTICLLSLLTISSLISYFSPRETYSGIPPTILVIVIGMFSLLLYGSRKGFVRTSSLLLISSYVLIIIYAVCIWSFVLPMILLGIILTITISSILLSVRAGILVTLFFSLVISSITLLQIQGIIPLNLYWHNDPISVQDIVEVCFIFFCIVGISWLSNSETEKSLLRARTSEQELIKERNLLELRVTERTQEIKELQQLQVAHLSHLAEFGKLSTGIFHDLISPLSGIIAHVDTLSRNHESFSEMKPSLTKVTQATKRMGKALTLVRQQLNPGTDRHLFNPSKEVQDAIDLLNYKARNQGVTITFNKEKETVQLFGPSFLFHQVALNIINNAIDSFTPEHRERHVSVSISYDTSINLFVSDNGSGIPKDKQSLVFNNFYTTKPNGNGIGLHHTKTIVENTFHGKISFDSDESNGTTFSVIIPLPTKSF